MAEVQEGRNVDGACVDHAARLAAMTFPDAVGSGDRAPNFVLPNTGRADVQLAALLERGPVVLVFYRGAWCPYCSLQLRGLQAALESIVALGATLVAVSPELPDVTAAYVAEAQLRFEVLSDVNGYVASDYGITFELPQEDRRRLASAGIDLKTMNGSDAWILPAPSTFVIAPDGVIEYARVDANYTSRPDVDEVLAVLGAIRGD